MSDWVSPLMSMTSRLSTRQTDSASPFSQLIPSRRDVLFSPNGQRLTVTWYPGIGNVHVHGQLLAPTPVDDDGRVGNDSPVVEELDSGERKDDRGGN